MSRLRLASRSRGRRAFSACFACALASLAAFNFIFLVIGVDSLAAITAFAISATLADVFLTDIRLFMESLITFADSFLAPPAVDFLAIIPVFFFAIFFEGFLVILVSLIGLLIAFFLGFFSTTPTFRFFFNTDFIAFLETFFTSFFTLILFFTTRDLASVAEEAALLLFAFTLVKSLAFVLAIAVAFAIFVSKYYG